MVMSPDSLPNWKFKNAEYSSFIDGPALMGFQLIEDRPISNASGARGSLYPPGFRVQGGLQGFQMMGAAPGTHDSGAQGSLLPTGFRVQGGMSGMQVGAMEAANRSGARGSLWPSGFTVQGGLGAMGETLTPGAPPLVVMSGSGPPPGYEPVFEFPGAYFHLGPLPANSPPHLNAEMAKILQAAKDNGTISPGAVKYLAYYKHMARPSGTSLPSGSGNARDVGAAFGFGTQPGAQGGQGGQGGFAPKKGMDTTTMILLGGAALGGLFLLTMPKGPQKFTNPVKKILKFAKRKSKGRV